MRRPHAQRAKATPSHFGSLLDRLIDDNRDDAAEDLPSLARLKEGLRRDLENLLNTRRRFLGWPVELEQLDRSLLSYGISDFTNETLTSAAFRQAFVMEVDTLLRRREPRISAFEVKMLDNTDPLDRRLRFRIMGSVRLGEEVEDLSFDSYIDPVECDIIVRD